MRIAPTLERACLSKAREGDDRAVADGRSFFEGHTGRLVRERTLLPDADVLGVCARPETEDLVADGEFADVRADGFDHSRQLHAEDPLLRSTESGEEPREERVCCP